MRTTVGATLVLGLLAGTASLACVNTAEDCAKLGTCTGGGGSGGSGGATGGGGSGGSGGATGGGGSGGSGATGGGGAGGATTTTTTPCPTQKVKSFGDAADQSALTIVTAPSDVALAGSFSGTLELGVSEMTAPGPGPSSFVARFSGELTPAVARRLDVDFMAGAVDGSGAFVAVGTQPTAVDLGCGSVGFDASYAMGLFVVKYDPNGICTFHTAFGATSITGVHVAADASGNIALAGGFEGMLAIGPEPALSSDGGVDIFAARLVDGGVPLWQYSNGGAGDDEARAVAMHSDGTIVVVGDHGGGVDFNLGDPTVASGGFPVPFLMTLKGETPVPQVPWARSFQVNDGGTARAAGVAIDTSDAAPVIVLSGDLTAITDAALVPSVFGDAAATLDEAQHGLFLARFTLGESGKLLASKAYAGTGPADMDDMAIGATAVDATGRILLGGWLDQGVTFAAGTGVLQSPGGKLAFMAVLDKTLTHQKSLLLGSSGGDNQAFGAAFLDGDVLLAGRYSGTLDVLGQTVVSEGGDDIFVVRLCAE